mmetsp:Transcript_1261/g.3936  ORF Transcript_1261/g.3936 Transcript_1261/m.3936 type:complete len:304 (+) Transcript_1261:229-1140(+)
MAASDSGSPKASRSCTTTRASDPTSRLPSSDDAACSMIDTTECAAEMTLASRITCGGVHASTGVATVKATDGVGSADSAAGTHTEQSDSGCSAVAEKPWGTGTTYSTSATHLPGRTDESVHRTDPASVSPPAPISVNSLPLSTSHESATKDMENVSPGATFADHWLATFLVGTHCDVASTAPGARSSDTTSNCAAASSSPSTTFHAPTDSSDTCTGPTDRHSERTAASPHSERATTRGAARADTRPSGARTAASTDTAANHPGSICSACSSDTGVTNEAPCGTSRASGSETTGRAASSDGTAA